MKLIAVVVFMVLSLGGALLVSQYYSEQNIAGQALPGSLKSLTPSFIARSRYDNVFSEKPVGHNDQFLGQISKSGWKFLYFGFTNCPDVCPMTLSILGRLFKKFENDSSMQELKFHGIFLSVDLENDNSEQAKEYASSFHPKISGLQVGSAALKQAMSYAGAGFSKKNGVISHSTSLYLVDPNGSVVGEFTNPANPEVLYKDFKSYISKKWHGVEISNLIMKAPKFDYPRMVVGYFNLKNRSQKTIRLKKVECPSFNRVELHDTVQDPKTKQSRMVPLNNPEIKKDETLVFKSKSKHLMIFPKKETPYSPENSYFCRFDFDTIQIGKWASYEHW